MRTTITLDDDVLERAREIASRKGTPFRKVVNDALRTGLTTVETPRKRSYRTLPHAMGLRPGMDLDNVQELLAQVEGEDAW